MKKKLKIEAIDLFSGIGGLTYGLRKAGIHVLAGLDNDKSCAVTYEKNNNAKFILTDVSTYDFRELKNIYSKSGVKVLVGCAPCQPFSAHTHKLHNNEKDERWNLLDHFVRAIQIIKPEVVSMENVRGVIKTNVFKNFVTQLKKMKYKVDFDVVYAPDYGVPQNRSRLILLASKLGNIKVPETTHSKENYVTVGDTIKLLPSLKAGQRHEEDKMHQAKSLIPINLKRIKQSKPGGSWKDWAKKILPACYQKDSGQTYTSVYGRMSWDNVSPTITTQFASYGSGRFGHPEQDRAISLREGALLQTFPISYEFGDLPMTQLCRHIGNAVPPVLGQVIGKTIIEHVMNVL